MTQEELDHLTYYNEWAEYYAALGIWLQALKEGSNPGGPPPPPTPPGGEA